MSGSISLEDMISCIQEWFAQCDKQLEYMCKVTNKEGD